MSEDIIIDILIDLLVVILIIGIPTVIIASGMTARDILSIIRKRREKKKPKSLLYEEERKYKLNVKAEYDDMVIFEFDGNIGKHGTFEPVAVYRYTSEELQEMFNDYDSKNEPK